MNRLNIALTAKCADLRGPYMMLYRCPAFQSTLKELLGFLLYNRAALWARNAKLAFPFWDVQRGSAAFALEVNGGVAIFVTFVR